MLHLLCWYVSNRQPHGCRPGVFRHWESGGKPCKVLKLGLKQVSSRRHDLIFNLVFNTATGHWIINIRSAWARLIPALRWRRGQVLPGSAVCSQFAMRTCSPTEPAGWYPLPPVGPVATTPYGRGRRRCCSGWPLWNLGKAALLLMLQVFYQSAEGFVSDCQLGM